MAVILGFILMIALGVPVGFSMVLAAFIYVLSTGAVSLTFIPQSMISGVSSYTMLAIPFFMLVGELMNSSGITKRIFRFANDCVGRITGGLGHVNVLSSMLFAGMSGAAVADCAGLGAIEIKAMTDEGFDADFSVGITAASSIIGPIIPPSSPMVMLGIAAGISIGSLFMGGIFSGYFTPTEAAAVAVFYSLIVGIFVYRELKWKDIIRVMTTGIENLGLVMLLMASGKTFAWVLGMEKVAERATEVLFSFTSSPLVILLLINLLLLFMGTFMETNASILILTPILMPIVTQIGVHPVQFGVIMIFALMIGLLTPPMAICLFLTSKLGGISFQRAFKAVTPYYIGLLIVLLLINVCPQITLAVPKLLLGSSF